MNFCREFIFTLIIIIILVINMKTFFFLCRWIVCRTEHFHLNYFLCESSASHKHVILWNYNCLLNYTVKCIATTISGENYFTKKIVSTYFYMIFFLRLNLHSQCVCSEQKYLDFIVSWRDHRKFWLTACQDREVCS